MKRPIKGNFEQDALTSWRKLYVYTQRAGVAKKAKRLANRRERREGKTEIRRGETFALDDLITPEEREEMAAWDADAYRICVEVPTSKITSEQLDALYDAIGHVVTAWEATLPDRDWDPSVYGHGPMHRNRD